MSRRGGASRFRLRMLPSLLLTAAILLVPAALYAYGRQADAFAVDTVKVSGTKRVPKKEALRLLRKAFAGRNLFTVTDADVRAALDRVCYVAAVEVDRDFPTTLRVRVIEHRPLLYVLAKGRWYLVADTGHVICRAGTEERLAAAADAVGQRPASASPTATEDGVASPSATEDDAAIAAATEEGAAAPSASPKPEETAAAQATQSAVPQADAGALASAVAAALKRGPAKMKPKLPRMATAARPKAGAAVRGRDVHLALRVLAALPSSLRARVRVVGVDDEGQVSLTLADGPLVELGGEERMRAKALSLRAVLAAYRRARIRATMVDVSAPERPLARPRLSS